MADSCKKACLTAQEISGRPMRGFSMEGRDALHLVSWLYSTHKTPSTESVKCSLYHVLTRLNLKTGEYYI